MKGMKNGGFQLQHEADDHFIVRHPSGDHLKIAKKGLSSDMVKQIKGFACGGRVQNYAEGTPEGGASNEVLPETQMLSSQAPPTIEAPPQAQSLAGPNAMSMGDVWQKLSQNWGAPAPSAEAIRKYGGVDQATVAQRNANPQAPPAQAPGPTPHQNVDLGTAKQTNIQANPPVAQTPGMPNAYGQMQTAIKGEQQGIQDMAAAQQQVAAAQAPIYSEEAAQQQKLIDTTTAHQKELYDQMMKTSQDMADGKIDANRVWNNRNTGEKVSTIIGMMLGGAPAVGRLQHEIDRDVAAQIKGKSDALQAFMHQYGDETQAAAALKLNLTAVAAAKINAAAAKMSNPMIQAKAKMDVNKLMADAIPELNNLAIQRTMFASANNASKSGAGGDPMAASLNSLRMMNPAMAKEIEGRYLPGIGVAQVPVTPENRKEISMRQHLDEALRDLESFAMKHSGSLDPKIINEGKTKAALAQDIYRQANLEGVFRGGEQGFVASMIKSDPSEFFATFRTLPGYRQTRLSNQMVLATKLKSLGINYSPSQLTPR